VLRLGDTLNSDFVYRNCVIWSPFSSGRRLIIAKLNRYLIFKYIGMRFIVFSYILSFIFLEFALPQLFSPLVLLAGEEVDLFKVNSVWHGTMAQANPMLSYPVILSIKKRKDNAFEGVTWYPTLGNGLILVMGRIEGKGNLTFSEDKVLYAEVYDNDQTVVAGPKYTAKLENTVLKGTGEVREYIDQNTQKKIKLSEPVKLAFSLKLIK
jgi:hypothetical protein